MGVPNTSRALLLGAAGADTGYLIKSIERSLRFNSADSAYLSRTPASAGNRKTWTWAGWVKRSGLGSGQALFGCNTGSASVTTHFYLELTSADKLQAAYTNGTFLRTTQVFRDSSAWFHLVVATDTTQATVSNRLKFYVNGSQVTTFDIANYPTQNDDTSINSANLHELGRVSATIYFSGYLADIHFIDGQALTPSRFGQFDTNGIWQPKAYTGTYGTNGFHLPFSDNSTAAALGTDTSGNGNNWTPNNITAQERNYVANCTGTPFGAAYSFANMFDGNTSTYMTPAAGTWAVFQPSPAISVSTLEIFGAWNGTASLAPKINNIDITNAPTGAAYQWFTPTLTGGASIASLNKFEFYTAGGSNAFIVAAIRINGSILISGSGAGIDSLVDSPTNGEASSGGDAGGVVVGNYCTWNPLVGINRSLANGNLDSSITSFSADGAAYVNFGLSSGKWYYENTIASMSVNAGLGIYSQSAVGSINGSKSRGYFSNGQKFLNGSLSAYGNSFGAGDTIGVAVDVDAGKVWFSKNGTWQASGDPATGSNAAFTDIASDTWFASMQAGYPLSVTANFGQRPFAYAAPSGFKSLNTANLPTPTILKGSDYFDTKLYTGNGSTQTISGLDFDPDLVWIKERSGAADHALYDTVRTATKQLEGNTTTAETTESTGLTAFSTGGFSLGALAQVNTNTDTYVAWCWNAGSSTVTNTDGSITSTVRANLSASVVTWTGSGSAGATVGHGLNVAPGLVIVKRRDSAGNWPIYTTVHGATQVTYLNTGVGPVTDSTFWNDTAPTSSVLSLGANAEVNNLGGTYVAYCYSEIQGYSKFFSFTGNGSTDGPFVYLGFRPRLIIWRRFGTTSAYIMADSSRLGYNPDNYRLTPFSSAAENTTILNTEYIYDFLSNGIKIRSTGFLNQPGNNYCMFAFAENPFALNARAR